MIELSEFFAVWFVFGIVGVITFAELWLLEFIIKRFKIDVGKAFVPLLLLVYWLFFGELMFLGFWLNSFFDL